jgi:hypothetical protein
MKCMKSFIAYLLVAIFLLGSIAVSAQALPEKEINNTAKVGAIDVIVCGL